MRNTILRLAGAAVFCAAAGAIAALIWFGPARDAVGEPSFDREAEATAADPAAAGSNGGTVWGEDYFPDVELITHEGERLRFFEDMVEDRVVAINFIYTTCPDACPMETARLREVADLLGDRMGKDVFFYSITIDPENDTPEVLAEHVENWQVGPGWKFLTGEEEDIVLLRRKLGIYIEEIQAEDSNDHNLTLIIGNQSTGQWIKRSPYENPHVLATQLGDWLHNWSLPRETERSYDEAPELRDISTGELLYRTRCESCHSIGRGDV
ncbi:MAG: SCO family protein, partial [Thermoanaerobaculia bacterium]